MSHRLVVVILWGVRPIPGTLHDGGARFELTHWTMVQVAAQNDAAPQTQEALTKFCQAYWPPLYTFLRRRGHKPADAQDLTQAFFAHLLEQNTLRRAAPEKGRLRSFLLGSLQNFLANEHDRASALKRGGGKQIVPIDDRLAEAEAAALSFPSHDVSLLFDEAWAATVVARAWERLQQSYAAEGRAAWLEQLKPFVVGGTGNVAPSQEETAARLNVPISTLRTWLQRVRERYRDTLRNEVAGTVTNPAEVSDELQYLFRLLMS